MLICTVKPVAVAVVVPNVGVNAAPSEVAVTSAEPPTNPVLVVVIVTVELALTYTPVTVIKPVPSFSTKPDLATVAAHV